MDLCLPVCVCYRSTSRLAEWSPEQPGVFRVGEYRLNVCALCVTTLYVYVVLIVWMDTLDRAVTGGRMEPEEELSRFSNGNHGHTTENRKIWITLA